MPSKIAMWDGVGDLPENSVIKLSIDLFDGEFGDVDIGHVITNALLHCSGKRIVLIATRFPGKMNRFIDDHQSICGERSLIGHGLRGVWLGVHLDGQASADRLIPELLQSKSRHVFLWIDSLDSEIHLDDVPVEIYPGNSVSANVIGRHFYDEGDALHKEYEDWFGQTSISWVFVDDRCARSGYAKKIVSDCEFENIPIYNGVDRFDTPCIK